MLFSATENMDLTPSAFELTHEKNRLDEQDEPTREAAIREIENSNSN